MCFDENNYFFIYDTNNVTRYNFIQHWKAFQKHKTEI